jgi:hypothetical protein
MLSLTDNNILTLSIRALGSNPDQNFGASFWGGSDPNFLGALFQYHVRCMGLTKKRLLTYKFLACPGHRSEGRPWHTGQSFNSSHLPGRAPTQLSWSVLPSKYCNLLVLALTSLLIEGDTPQVIACGSTENGFEIFNSASATFVQNTTTYKHITVHVLKYVTLFYAHQTQPTTNF